MSETKLLPCPFCGILPTIMNEDKNTVFCATPSCALWSRIMTIKKWNTRPTQDTKDEKEIFMAGFHFGRNANHDYEDEKYFGQFKKGQNGNKK
jgi:hypothetical protein